MVHSNTFRLLSRSGIIRHCCNRSAIRLLITPLQIDKTISRGQRTAAPQPRWGRTGEKVLSGEEGSPVRRAALPGRGDHPGAARAPLPAPPYLPERLPVPALHETGVPARREVGAEAPEPTELLPLPGRGLPGVEHPGRRGCPAQRQQQEQPAAPHHAAARPAARRCRRHVGCGQCPARPVPPRCGGRSRCRARAGTPAGATWGCRCPQPKPWVSWHNNTCRRCAVPRTAGFFGGVLGFTLFTYLLAYFYFQSHLLKWEGKKLLEKAKKSIDGHMASWRQARG